MKNVLRLRKEEQVPFVRNSRVLQNSGPEKLKNKFTFPPSVRALLVFLACIAYILRNMIAHLNFCFIFLHSLNQTPDIIGKISGSPF